LPDARSDAERHAARGDFHAALTALAPSLRRRLPPLEAFYDFVGDQDLLFDNPGHPSLTEAEKKKAERGLRRLKPGPARSLIGAYALLCARRYAEAARAAAAIVDAAHEAHASLLEACALWLLGDSRRSPRWRARALERAERAATLEPSRRALLLRAQIRMELEDNRGGLEDLGLMLRRDPKDLSARIGRVEALADQYLLAPAERELERILKIRPARWWFYAQRGRLRGVCGRLDSALSDFDEAVRRQPRRGAVRAWRGELLRKLGRLGESRAELGRAAALEPRYAFTFECRGRLLLMLGLPRLALADLERACRLDPARTLAFAWRAEARLRLGRLRGAWADLERVHPMDPLNFWNADDAVDGPLPDRARRHASYWRALDAAVSRAAGDGTAWLLRGRGLLTAGRGKEALSDLACARRLLARAPAPLRDSAREWHDRARGQATP
jgi:tetratricopeptide (TPR) repeat protein